MIDRTDGREGLRAEKDLRAALEAAGHRYTVQRAAVHRALGEMRSHPTADEIFTAVRRRIPDISLATVYKALETLVACDLALKLPTGDRPARYDGRTDAHDHLCCLGCGRVMDVEGGARADWMDSVDPPADFEICGYRLVLLGYCGDCRH